MSFHDMFHRSVNWLSLTLFVCASCATVGPSPEAVHYAELCERDFQATRFASPEGEVDCGRAVQLNPSDARSESTLGILLLRRGDRDKAKQSLESALARSPRQSRAIWGLAVVRFWQSRFAESAQFFAKAIAREPQNLDLQYNQALALYFAKDTRQASKLLVQLVTRSPQFASAWHLLAVIELDDDYSDQAIRFERRALDADATPGAEWVALGVAYERLSRREDAEYAFRSCLDLSPQDRDCRKELELLLRGEPLVAPKVAPLRF